jgi:hypothetical protein
MAAFKLRRLEIYCKIYFDQTVAIYNNNLKGKVLIFFKQIIAGFYITIQITEIQCVGRTQICSVLQ